MKRHAHNPSRARVTIVVSLAAAVVVCLFNFTDAGAGIARAGVALTAYHQDEGFFPRRAKKSVFDSTGTAGYPTAPIPIELVSMQLVSSGNPLDSIPLPPPGTSAQIDSFFDVFTELSLGPSSPPHPVDSFFDITYRISGQNTNGNDGIWQTEILALELKGQVPGPSGPVPVIIRESPTQSSQGAHRLMTLPGGTFQIDSFFDVFTEISLDGGGSYHASSSPLRLGLTRYVPEPASIVLAMLGVMGVGALARRRGR